MQRGMQLVQRISIGLVIGMLMVGARELSVL